MQSVFASSQRREQLAEGAFKWLLDNWDLFDPPQEDVLLEQAPESIGAGASRKAFGELGLLLRLVQRVPELRDRPAMVTLRAEWLAKIKARRSFFDIRRRVNIFPLCAVALAVMDALGSGDERARRSLQNVLDRGWMDRMERSAWSMLDIKFYLEASGLRHGFPDDATLFEASSLRHRPDLAYVTTRDLYGITHLLFHFSDFGARDIRPLLGAQHAAICEYTKLALSLCTYDEDFDLAAELLISLICLGQRDDALFSVASDALCLSQQSTGFVPDRKWLAGLEEAVGSPERRREEFFAVYHPTIVALLLVACDMAAEKRPPGVSLGATAWSLS